MSYSPNRGAIALYGTSKAPKIPLQLALSLLNEASRPVRSSLTVSLDNMEPTLMFGTPVTIEQISDPYEVQPDQIYYIIDHNLRGSFRRVSLDRNEDYLRIGNDNPDKNRWPSQYMRITSLRAIFRVIS